jgi:hypothetical protein
MSLWSIQSELASVLAALDEPHETDAEMDAALEEHAAALRDTLAVSAEKYADLITSLEARGTARMAESQRVAELAASDDRKAARLRAMLFEAMTATKQEKIETVRFKLSIRTNGGALPVEITDATAIPMEFKPPKVVESIDKKAILAALVEGRDVPGCRLGERGRTLKIA